MHLQLVLVDLTVGIGSAVVAAVLLVFAVVALVDLAAAAAAAAAAVLLLVVFGVVVYVAVPLVYVVGLDGFGVAPVAEFASGGFVVAVVALFAIVVLLPVLAVLVPDFVMATVIVLHFVAAAVEGQAPFVLPRQH